MQKNIIPMLLALVLTVGVAIPTTSANAALITNDDIAEQKAVLDEAVRHTLFEELKLIQMLLIQLLEERIDHLNE